MLVLALAGMLACALAQTSTPEYWASTFTFIGDTDWFNPDNWVNGIMPSAGSVTSFPASFTNFGAEQCLKRHIECPHGGNTYIRVQDGSAEVDVPLGRLDVPVYGKIRLGAGVRLQFFPVSNTAGTGIRVALWQPRNTSDFDFRCAKNWGVNGTGLNPGFIVPCYLDNVVFPDGQTFMVRTPANTYVNPSGNFIPTDPYQYTGYPLQYDTSTCPQPFTSNQDPSNCYKICFNTCPELNPSATGAAKQMLAQNKTLVNYLAAAIPLAQQAFPTSISNAIISGTVSFPIPATATPTAIQNVVNKTRHLLTPNFPYNMNITCSSSTTSGVGVIQCNAAVLMPTTALPAFTSNIYAPYRFNAGALSNMFGGIIQEWFNIETTNALAAAAAQAVGEQFFIVTVSVPTRFINALGTPFPTSAFATSLLHALAQQTQVSSVNILTAQVLASHGARTQVLSLTIAQSPGVSQSAVTAILTSRSPIFAVSLAASSVPIFVQSSDTVANAPSAQSLGVVSVVITNPALYVNLPLNATGAAAFYSNLVSLFSGQKIYDVSVARQSSSGRRIPGQNVVLTLYVPSETGFAGSVTPSAFNRVKYNNVGSTGVSVTPVSITQNEIQQLQTNAVNAAAAAAAALAYDAKDLRSLALGAVAREGLGAGTYTWTDINIVDDSQNQYFGLNLTNQECSNLLASLNSTTVNQTTFQAAVAQQMTQLIPVPAGAIVFNTNLICYPIDASESLPDQGATFNVQMVIASLYTSFAKGANYVTYNGPINPALQVGESFALLSKSRVRSALQLSLRVVVLQYLQSYYNLQINHLGGGNGGAFNGGNGASSSSAAASLPIIPVAAGAGGGALFVILLLVILLRRRNNTPDNRTKDARSVVAFENPMYDKAKRGGSVYDKQGKPERKVSYQEADPTTYEGLYDEPAFKKTLQKNNPLFDSKENLAANQEFGAAIGALGSASTGYALHADPTYGDAEGLALNEHSAFMEPDDPAGDGGYLDVDPNGVPLGRQDTYRPAPTGMPVVPNPLYGGSSAPAAVEQSIYDNDNDPTGAPAVQPGDEYTYNNNDQPEEVPTGFSVAAGESIYDNDEVDRAGGYIQNF